MPPNLGTYSKPKSVIFSRYLFTTVACSSILIVFLFFYSLGFRMRPFYLWLLDSTFSISNMPLKCTAICLFCSLSLISIKHDFIWCRKFRHLLRVWNFFHLNSQYYQIYIFKKETNKHEL
jgi:hypothetical protein